MDTFMEQFAEKNNAQEMIKANTNAELEELKGKLADLNEDLQDGYHKECVKVYRNVQAAMIDENGKQTALLKEELDKMEGRQKQTWLFAILAFAASMTSLLLQILSVLKVFH